MLYYSYAEQFNVVLDTNEFNDTQTQNFNIPESVKDPNFRLNNPSKIPQFFKVDQNFEVIEEKIIPFK